MTLVQAEKDRILDRAREYFSSRLIRSHRQGIDGLSLSDFKINPFLVRYLAGCLSEDIDSDSVARALVYPRTLGTSVNTIFGNVMQGFCKDVLAEVFPSVVTGMDIEYTDALDGRHKYCQVKSGPNTINKDDVDTIRNKFKDLGNLARQNGLPLQTDDMVVGVLYGSTADLSGHYVRINRDVASVYIGRDFWLHLTGDAEFYDDLVFNIAELADEADMSDALEEAIARIAKEVRASAELGFGSRTQA